MCKYVGDCDAILARTADFNQQVLEKGTKLKIVARHGAGLDNIDLEYARKRGIVVTNTPGANSNSVAEHLLNIVLEDAGLTQKDVEIVALEQADMLSVLQTGGIDAAAVWEPRISQSKDYAFRLADGEGVYDKDGKQTKKVAYKYFCNPFAANTSFTKDNKEITTAVLKALEMGAKYTDENTEDAINILADYTGVDANVASASVNCEDRDVKITDEKIDVFKATVEFLISSNQFNTSSDDCVIKSAGDITKYINTSYYDAIK